MGFKLIFAGLIFFMNPCINIVDILPDFIGCILISAGLYRLADTEDRFLLARKIADRIIPIYILKLVLSLYIPVAWKSGLLPITFVFAVGEIILMIMLCTALYGGIEYMANLHNGEKVLPSVGTVQKITIAFMVVKNVLAFIPESFALESGDEFSLYNSAKVQRLEQAKPFVIVFFTLVVLIFGIYCLIENYRFFKKVWRDKEFCSSLAEIYKTRVTDNQRLINRRRFKRFFVLMTVGSVMMIDIVIDSVNFTPDILGYAVMLSAVACLARRRDTIKAVYVFLPLAAVSLVSTVFFTYCGAGINYLMGYESYLLQRNVLVENGTAIVIGAVLSAAEAILFVLFMLFTAGSAAKTYADVSGKYFSPLPPVIISAVLGLCSIFSGIAPLIKAKYYYEYINDTLVNASYSGLSDMWADAQAVGNAVLIVVVCVLAYWFIKTGRKADIEL